MIVEPELRAWCNDTAAQRRARLDADAFAARWNHGKANTAFAKAMAGLRKPGAQAAAGAIRALFEDDRWVDALIGGLADALRNDPYFEPPFRHLTSDVHSGLVVYEDEHVSVAAGVTSQTGLAEKKSRKHGPSSVAFSGQVEVFKFVKAGGARLSIWEAPPITADFTAAEAGRCRRTGEHRLEDGEILVVDGRCQSFVIEHAAASLVVLQATVKPDRAPVGVEYDSATGEYVGCSAADDSASRIQMIATLLRKLGCEAAFPAIAAFVGHPNFFVRWHVMRELLGLDAVASLPHLRRMAASDPHGETRRAARRLLERVELSLSAARKAA